MSSRPFAPTHTIPEGGLPAWAAPDPAAAPVANLGARLPVEVVETAGDWARVVCSNGWVGWVDGRRLPVPAPAAVVPPVPTPAPAATPAPAPAPTAATTVSGAQDPAGQTPAYPAAAPAETWATATSVPPAPAADFRPSSQHRATRPHSGGGTVTIGRVIAGIGGLLVVASGWLDWIAAVGNDKAYDAYLFPAHFLLNNRSVPGSGGVSLGLVVLVLGLLALVTTFLPRRNPGPVVIGIVVTGIAVLYLYQLYTLVDDIGGSIDFTDVLAVGPFLAGAGGFALIIGGIFDWVTRSRRSAASRQA